MKKTSIILALIMIVGCQSDTESSTSANDNAEQAPQETLNDPQPETGEVSKLDQEVYAYLYAQQSLHATEGYLLPESFDALKFAEALIEVEAGISSFEDEGMAKVIALAASEEILRSVAELIMEGADTDASSKIDYDEFMQYRIGNWEPTAELDANINAWRQEAYPIVSGFDLEIDEDELLALLVMQREYVLNMRADPELFRKLVDVTREQFVNNFDENGDGELDQDELDDIRDAIKDERDRYLERVDETCSDEDNAEEPICQIDQTLTETCAEAEEDSLLDRLCDSLLGK